MVTSAIKGSSKRIKNRVESVLPDDVVIEILLRVPAKDLLRCRCVCIRWKNFTSNQKFMDLHSRRSIPVILAEDPLSTKRQFNKFLFDRWWEPTKTRSVIHKFKTCPVYRMYFSQAGFVVFRYLKSVQSSIDFIIHNPVYNEEVRIVIPRRLWAEVYGIFFNPNLNEYCILLGVSLLPSTNVVQYKLVNLGSEPCWRGLNSPWCHRPKSYLYFCSVFIDRYLYWFVVFEEGVEDDGCYDVMEFDTHTEEFRLFPCPVPKTLKDDYVCENLLSNDGLLSFVRISLEGMLFVINIWTLKDRVEQLWMSSKYIIKIEGYHPGRSVQALAVVDNELVVRSNMKLFVCNLQLGISRNFDNKNYNHNAQFLSHVMTLASLKNCKTRIYLEEREWEDAAKTKKCLVSDSLDGKKDGSS